MNQIKCPNCGEIFTIDEADYASIVKQIKDSEYKEDLARIEKQYQKETNDAVKLAEAESKESFTEQLNKKNAEIAKLQAELDKKDADNKLVVANEVAKVKEQLSNKEAEVKELSLKLDQKDTETKLAVSEAVSIKNEEINVLKANKQALEEGYKKQLADKDELVAYYKDFKAKQSTKMIGESLEQHCQYEFNKIRATAFKNAYFDKDNDARTGSKGDFIFRDYDDEGTEFVSIMFEMKNEADTTATKHKNSDFFKELDKDRNEKGCEYAILVSMLEPDNDLYNEGIVDVSYEYPKMYVVRPQFFIPIITLIRNAATNSLDYKKELQIIHNQNLDYAQFEDNMNQFKDAFGKNYELASRKFQDAIDDIDKTIKALEKTKADLMSSDRNLRLANDKAQDLSIKKLTKNAPSVAEKFDEIKK